MLPEQMTATNARRSSAYSIMRTATFIRAGEWRTSIVISTRSGMVRCF